MNATPINLDDLLTVEQFAAWRQEPVSLVRKRLAYMPGVVRESRENVRVHPRTYLEGMLKKGRR
ncbi:MAG: hypothetical protein ABFD89_06710 [Bryobacteraceae bacterium]